jgi:SPP1 family predicted phage head-tail adaptor
MDALMRASDLDYRVTLELPSQSIASGNATPVWTTQDTAWAKMEGIGGTFAGLTMEADFRFTLRYRTDVTPRWRIGLSGTSRKFTIVRPPQNEDGKRVDLVIYAKEILA